VGESLWGRYKVIEIGRKIFLGLVGFYDKYRQRPYEGFK
jgi:hypothetical protein